MVLSVVARCMSGEEEKMSLEIWCDLLEAELKRALEDLSVIRGLDKAQAKSKSHMLKEALDKAVAENFRTATGIETRSARLSQHSYPGSTALRFPTVQLLQWSGQGF
jgi:hypothetical protein